MIDLFVTDYGDVCLSEREAAILSLAQDIRSGGDPTYPPCKALLAKADTIRAACERFAKHRLGIV